MTGSSATNRAAGGGLGVAAATLATLLLAAGLGRAGECPPAERTGAIDLCDVVHIREGEAIFNGLCAGYCHGSEGRAKRGPALRRRADLDEVTLYYLITNGRQRGNPMPAFKGLLSEEQIWKVIAYIVSLRETQD
jgi:mono/diheme cytochrome c family protein